MGRKTDQFDEWTNPEIIAEIEAAERVNYNKKVFSEPWCPLFGWWPDFDPPALPNSQVDRCLEIITQAREIWEIGPFGNLLFEEDEDGLPTQLSADSSYPDPEEVSEYPKEALESARTIFIGRHSTFQHAGWDRINPSTPTPLKDLWRGLVSFAKQGYVSRSVDPQVPDYAILAILALGEAWDSLCFLCDGGDGESDPSLIKRVQGASDLIHLAKSMEMEEDAEAGWDAADQRGKELIEALNSAKEMRRRLTRSKTPKLREKETEFFNAVDAYLKGLTGQCRTKEILHDLTPKLHISESKFYRYWEKWKKRPSSDLSKLLSTSD